MRGTMILALVSMLALAGCTGGTDEPDPTSTQTGTTTQSGTPSGTTTSSDTSTTETQTTGGNETPSTENVPPTATLSASSSPSNPLSVNFTVDGADEDGDELSWTLDVDSDGGVDFEGSSVPGTVQYEYPAGGTYEATLVLTDNVDSVTETVTLNLTAGNTTVQSTSGSWEAGEPTSCAGASPNPYHPANQAANGVTMLTVDVVPESIGLPFRADFGTLPGDAQSAHMHFSNPGTITLESFSGSGDPTVIEGVVPADAEVVTFRLCGASGGSVTYEVA